MSTDIPAGSTLSFKVGPFQLPDTIAGGKGLFRVTTYVDFPAIGINYPVDSGTASNLFTITVGAISTAKVTPSSIYALIKSDFKFEVTPDHKIP